MPALGTYCMREGNKIRIGLIGTTGIPARYGGFETLAHQLVSRLGFTHDFTVYCSGKYYPPSKRISSFQNARLVYFPLNANGYQSILYDYLSIIHALLFCDVLLVLGISGAFLFPFIKLFSRKPVIVNIDGQEWKRAKWNYPVRKFLKWSERLAVLFADSVITDNEAIRKYVKDEYGKDSLLIEYGADHVLPSFPGDDEIKKYPFLSSDYAFAVCRIEPENNVHLILDAWTKAGKFPLVIVGLWNHGEFGVALKKKYSGIENIILLDPVYDQQEIDLLRGNCTFYLHGHSAGGTNPSLAEAMFLGRAIVAYDVIFNRETTENKARYFINSQDLAAQLSAITSEDILRIKNDMQSIASKRYVWKTIAGKYNEEILRLAPGIFAASVLTSKELEAGWAPSVEKTFELK